MDRFDACGVDQSVLAAVALEELERGSRSPAAGRVVREIAGRVRGPGVQDGLRDAPRGLDQVEVVAVARVLAGRQVGDPTAGAASEQERQRKEAAAAAVLGLTIFVRDARPIESIAQRLTNGGRSPVRLVFLQERGREIELSLGEKFTVTPQINVAIKAIAGVVDVQDF